MNDTPAPRNRSLVEALVALAARDGLGEVLNWIQVRAAIAELATDPLGPRDLRYVLNRRRMNNLDEIASTLEDWFIRAAAEREADSKDASRAAEKLLAPVQALSFTGAATSGLGFVLGTITSTIAAPVALSLLVVAGAATLGRWRLSKRCDEADADATGIRRLADIARNALD